MGGRNALPNFTERKTEQPNAKQAIKKMIWHYEYELLCATNSSDKEKFAEKIIEWSERLGEGKNDD